MIAWQHFHIFTWWTGRPGMLQSMGSPKVGHDLGSEQLNNNYKLVEEFEFIRTPISPSPLFPGVNISLHCSHSSLSITHTYKHTLLFLHHLRASCRHDIPSFVKTLGCKTKPPYKLPDQKVNIFTTVPSNPRMAFKFCQLSQLCLFLFWSSTSKDMYCISLPCLLFSSKYSSL